MVLMIVSNWMRFNQELCISQNGFHTSRCFLVYQNYPQDMYTTVLIEAYIYSSTQPDHARLIEAMHAYRMNRKYTVRFKTTSTAAVGKVNTSHHPLKVSNVHIHKAIHKYLALQLVQTKALVLNVENESFMDNQLTLKTTFLKNLYMSAATRYYIFIHHFLFSHASMLLCGLSVLYW